MVQLLLVLRSLLAMLFWIWMSIDLLIHEPTAVEKLRWFLVIFFLNLYQTQLALILSTLAPA